MTGIPSAFGEAKSFEWINELTTVTYSLPLSPQCHQHAPEISASTSLRVPNRCFIGIWCWRWHFTSPPFCQYFCFLYLQQNAEPSQMFSCSFSNTGFLCFHSRIYMFSLVPVERNKYNHRNTHTNVREQNIWNRIKWLKWNSTEKFRSLLV